MYCDFDLHLFVFIFVGCCGFGLYLFGFVAVICICLCLYLLGVVAVTAASKAGSSWGAASWPPVNLIAPQLFLRLT